MKACKHAVIQPDKAGRIVMRRDTFYPCLAPLPPLPGIDQLPVSVTRQYRFVWPPREYAPGAMVNRGDCEGCPLYEARPKGGAS